MQRLCDLPLCRLLFAVFILGGGCSPDNSVTTEQQGSAQFESPIVALIVPTQFEQYHFQMLWFRSKVSNLALGLNIGNFKDSNFGTRVHDFSTGNGEYSCFPDDVLLSEADGAAEAAYAGYLRWQLHAHIAEDGQSAKSVYLHKAGSGMLDEYIEPQILLPMSDSSAEMQVTHTLRNGLSWVVTSVRIKNAGTQTRHFYWTYQDGVFLFLPAQNQLAVKPITSNSIGRYDFRESERSSWIGSFDAEHQIASILYSPNPGYLFALPNYVLVSGIDPRECTHLGFPCNKGGNDRFALQPNPSFAALKAQAETVVGTESTPASLKIHGLVLDFGELPPGAERTLRFFRLGLQGQSTQEEVAAAVAQVIAAHHGGELS